MKTIPAILQSHLDEQVNTTCLLLRIERNAGAFGTALPVLGVTTLDQDVTYDDGDGAVTYSAASGFVPSNLSASGDMGVDNAEAEILVPAFDLGPVVEADINAGRYDSAPFILYRVNYKDLTTGRHEIIMSGTLGQARTVGGLSAFCELRSISQQFKQTVCEVDSITCRADFGSTACGVDISTLWETGTVSAVGTETDREFSADTALAEGDLVPGIVQWLTGDNAGRSYEIEAHTVDIGGGSGGSPGDATAISILSKVVAWWELDETSGTTMTDSHTNGLNGTYSGLTVNQTALAANLGKSVTFPSGNNYAEVADNALLKRTGDLSVMTWIKRNGAQAAFPKLVWKPADTKASGHANYLIFYENSTGKANFRLRSAGVNYTATSTTSIADATVYQIIGTRNGVDAKIWINGVNEATATLPGSANLATSIDPLRFGYHGNTGDPWVGSMDQTAFFNAALTSTEIAYLYNSGAGISYSALSAAASGGGAADLGAVQLTFPTAFPIEVGDTFKWRPDCGKQFIRDCKNIWNNVLNFRGEPYIPVADEASMATPGANKPGPNSGTPVDNPWTPPA